MKKLYLAHPLSTTGEFNDSIRVAKQIEEIFNKVFIGDVSSVEDMRCGDSEINSEGDIKAYLVNQKFEVYAPALNKSINDKSNNPTPEMIYEQDVDNLVSADVVVINYTSGRSHGTILELGILAGLCEAGVDLPKVFVYSSNRRMLQPQFWNGIASEGANHMVLGAIEKHFIWCESEDEMLYELEQM